MDIIHDPSLKKNESEPGLEKPSLDSIGTGTDEDDFLEPVEFEEGDTYELDGVIYQMPPDLKYLKEIDYNDPDVQKWLEEERLEHLAKWGRITHEEMDQVYARRLELEKLNPTMTATEAVEIARQEYLKRKKVSV